MMTIKEIEHFIVWCATVDSAAIPKEVRERIVYARSAHREAMQAVEHARRATIGAGLYVAPVEG